ncbi:PRC-barrel domain containing protein [Kitasatospora purpeofusca]|uniref:PRC-barrel domain containing protein n=1 Tax=Kitasatospora purpeofusca TaxID=67352 RepID=UPI0036B144D0
MNSGLWDYSNAEGYGATLDLTGYRVEAEDGPVGKVDRHSQDVDFAHIVVDTGPWIFGREILLPAGTVRRVDTEERAVWLNRTKDEIKNAPEYHKDQHTGDLDYHLTVGDYYSGAA